VSFFTDSYAVSIQLRSKVGVKAREQSFVITCRHCCLHDSIFPFMLLIVIKYSFFFEMIPSPLFTYGSFIGTTLLRKSYLSSRDVFERTVASGGPSLPKSSADSHPVEPVYQGMRCFS